MPTILKINPENPEESLIKEAVEILKKSGVVAYPTETFYGLGVDAHNSKAIEKIYDIKGRDYRQPISIIIGDKKDLTGLVEDIPKVSLRLMEKFWPGGLTIVFKASSAMSNRLTGRTGKIGIRLSSNIIATRLAKVLSNPITATSANISGTKECSSAGEVINCFKDKIDAVIDGGQTPGGPGSTFVDVTTDPPKILREGIIHSSLLKNTLRQI